MKHTIEQSAQTEPVATGAEAEVASSQITPMMQIAPKPMAIKDTGLSLHFLAELLSKHLFDGGVMTVKQLAERLALPGAIVEKILDFLRQEAEVELRSNLGSDELGLHYALTDKGLRSAQQALLKSGYIGPAPVPLSQYTQTVLSQSVHLRSITREQVLAAFKHVTIKESLLDQFGPALNSGRAMFIYGPPGTGKTYITQHLSPLFEDRCLIPFAISVDETVIQVFDPAIHHRESSQTTKPSLLFEGGHDARYLLCQRPIVVSGGELTLDLLEVRYDPSLKQYQAPLQLKANNGIFIIDDMGRQQASPMEIFNRWIVPLEEKHDYLTLSSGRHFEVPFDLVMVFSSNINPLELADEAFLRRIGYKIHFGYISKAEYQEIWEQECIKRDIPFDDSVLSYVFDALYSGMKTPLLPCHPRDLLGIADDTNRYLGHGKDVDEERISSAWGNYFVKL